MTNRERYQQTFSKLHVSEAFCLQREREKKSRRLLRPALTALLAAALLLGAGVFACADSVSQGLQALGVSLGLVSHEVGEFRVSLGDMEFHAREKDVYAWDYFGMTEYGAAYRLSESERAIVLPLELRDASDADLRLFHLSRLDGIRYLAVVTERGDKTIGLMVNWTAADGTEYHGQAVWPDCLTTDASGRVGYSWSRPGLDEAGMCSELVDLTERFDAAGRAEYVYEIPVARTVTEDGTVVTVETAQKTLRVQREGDIYCALLFDGTEIPDFAF